MMCKLVFRSTWSAKEVDRKFSSSFSAVTLQIDIQFNSRSLSKSSKITPVLKPRPYKQEMRRIVNALCLETQSHKKANSFQIYS